MRGHPWQMPRRMPVRRHMAALAIGTALTSLAIAGVAALGGWTPVVVALAATVSGCAWACFGLFH